MHAAAQAADPLTQQAASNTYFNETLLMEATEMHELVCSSAALTRVLLL
jgi:hypothetical protein